VSKNIPYFAFYPKDFLGDAKVQLMNAMERGAYISLLCVAWGERPIASLPGNDMMLARWSCLTLEEFQAHKEMIMAPFELRDDGRWYQKRLESEANKVERISETRRKAIGKRWEVSKDTNVLHMNYKCNTNELHEYYKRDTKNIFLNDVCNTIPEPEPEPEPESEKERNPLTPLQGEVAPQAPQRAKSRAGPPNLEDLVSFCSELGLPKTDAEYYDDHWKANGYRIGSNRVRDWKAVIRNHKRHGWLQSQQKTNNPGRSPPKQFRF